MKIFAFECYVAGMEHCGTTVINAPTRGKAKSRFFLDSLADCDIPFICARARKIGAVQNTRRFSQTAQYRGVNFNCGDEVEACGERGVVVDSNSSANFDVTFLTGKHKGLTLNVHPSEIKSILTP